MERSRGKTHVVMEPMELTAKLAALVPPPRYPLVRYHGVLAPNSPWRGAIVPGPRGRLGDACGHDENGVEEDSKTAVDAKPRPASVRLDWAALLHRVWGMRANLNPDYFGNRSFWLETRALQGAKTAACWRPHD